MKKAIVGLSVISWFAVSCSPEEIQSKQDCNNFMEFRANTEIGAERTKTHLELSNEGGVHSIYWDKDDKVLVSNGDTESIFDVSNINGSEADLHGYISQSNSYIALYPPSFYSRMSSETDVLINLPSTQSYTIDNFEKNSFPMAANTRGHAFQFKNICGILVVPLIGDIEVKSIKFTGKNERGESIIVAGAGRVGWNEDGSPVLNMTTGGKTSVTLDCMVDGNGVSLSKTVQTNFYIILPPNIYNSFELTIESTAGYTYTQTGSKPLTIPRAKRIMTSSLECIKETSLSSHGTANCYIVSRPGFYSFMATKGNSAETINNVASVDIIWETFNTDVKPNVGDLINNVAYTDGKISFSTPLILKDGNALIAVKDSKGEILWSWHIWLCLDYVNGVTEQKYYISGTFMDRNLGALKSEPGNYLSNGFFYQWGRKDPFMGACSISENKQAITSEDVFTVVDMGYDILTKDTSLDYSIKNPTTFIRSKSSPRDWFCNNEKYRNDNLWESTKTQYDPCPPGWKVPRTYNGKDGATPPNWDTNKKGMNFGNFIGEGSMIWYPANGTFEGSLSGTGYTGNAWTNKYYNGNYGIAAYSLFYSHIDSPGSTMNNRYYGKAIRCCKE